MKIVAFNGSSKKNGNTFDMIKTVLDELSINGIETEIVNMSEGKIRGCTGCVQCFKNKNKKCVINDSFNEYFSKMIEADGIILGSPTYFADVSTEMKALIDRAGFVAIANDHILKRKIGAAVVAVRRAGSIHAFDTMNHLFFITQMIVPGSSYWNMSIAWKPGEYLKDKEGVQTMKTLGENMLWLLKKTR